MSDDRHPLTMESIARAEADRRARIRIPAPAPVTISKSMSDRRLTIEQARAKLDEIERNRR